MTYSTKSSLSLTYPPDWEDEERMHFLLSPFPPSAVSRLSLNDQKIQFWSSLVHHACRVFRQPVFSGQQMAQRLQWKSQGPSCLHHVLILMQQTGQLRLVKEEEESRAESWLKWGVSVLSSPIRWVWHSTTNTAVKIYVDTQLLKEVAASVLQQLQSRVEFKCTDRVITGAQFRAVCLELADASSLSAVESELSRQGKIRCIPSSSGRQLVKFGMVGEAGPVYVSDMDQGILSLKENIATVHMHVSSLTNKIEVLRRQARHHLQLKQRQLALHCLQRGHEVQKLLTSKTAMLENLQHILCQIQMAETNGLVLEAYQRGAEALKAMQPSSLSLTGAEDIVEELQEAMHANNELGEVVGEEMIDENVDKELERELQSLLSCAEPSQDSQVVCSRDDDGLAEQLARLQLIPDTTATSYKTDPDRKTKHKPLPT